jgi:acyl-homoserine-lactone acylase
VTVQSVAATLYFLSARPKLSVESLVRTQKELEGAFGTWRVPWGEVNRLQRIHSSGTQESFSDSRPSLPVAGCPGTLGCIFVFNTRKPEGAKRAYGYSGDTYVAVVEFGRKVRAESLLVFGQSADPASPHFFDQAPLYSEKRFKRAR